MEIKKGLSLRSKMLWLFSVLPTLVFIGLAMFYLLQLNKISSLVQQEGEKIVRGVAEDAIKQKAQSTATEIERFILDHPELTSEQLSQDPKFAKIVDQKVGVTGYIAVVDGPFYREDDRHIIIGHPVAPLLGQPLKNLEQALGENYKPFRAVLDSVVSNEGYVESYYTWKDQDGRFRDKYLATAKVARTQYYVAATTYINEFTQPMETLRATSKEIINQALTIIIIITAITIIIIFIVVTQYGNRIGRRIESLAISAERISKGDITTPIEGIGDKDEIGVMSQSIDRLRKSVAILIKRVRSSK